MMPRFLKTFLLASLLIILPTLFILYQKHSDGSEWNEWSLNSGTWDAWSSPNVDDKSALYLEDHWNAGGAVPNYESPRIIDAEREGGAYRLGDTTIDLEELEAFKRWRTKQSNDESSSDHGTGTTSVVNTWSDDASVHGGVIMPKLGNATAKYVGHCRLIEIC